MKVIKNIVDKIDEELQGAQCYAEHYVEAKAAGNAQWANRFHSMAEDELAHAGHMHEYAVEQIDSLKKVFKPPQDMLDAWETAHKEYVGKAAWIKQMLAM